MSIELTPRPPLRHSQQPGGGDCGGEMNLVLRIQGTTKRRFLGCVNGYSCVVMLLPRQFALGVVWPVRVWHKQEALLTQTGSCLSVVLCIHTDKTVVTMISISWQKRAFVIVNLWSNTPGQNEQNSSQKGIKVKYCKHDCVSLLSFWVD